MPSEKTVKASRPAGPPDESIVDETDRRQTFDGAESDVRAEAHNGNDMAPEGREPIALGGRGRGDGLEADPTTPDRRLPVAGEGPDADPIGNDRTDVADRTESANRPDVADRVDAADRATEDGFAGVADRPVDPAVEVLHDNRPTTPIDDEPVSPEPLGVGSEADRRPAGDGDRAAEQSSEPAELAPGDIPAPRVAAVWPGEDTEAVRQRWRELQSRFVDDPHGAAAEADDLVGEAVEGLTAALSEQRQRLGSWRAAGEFDTEQLRVAVTGYRDFLDRVLSI